MIAQSFDLAPPSRSVMWDQAVTIAFLPALTLFGCVGWLTGAYLLAGVTALIAFGMTLLFAIPLARPNLGRITLTADSLELHSGYLHARLRFDQLELDRAHLAAGADLDKSACLRLTTSHDVQVVIPRADGTAIHVSPVDPQALLQALRAHAPAPVA